MPPRMVGLYALATMERDGTLHGYLLAQRIAERTGGSWRPSAGTIYPSLRSLEERGLARRRGTGRRQVYRITPAGRALLRRIRRRTGPSGSAGPDVSTLWAEVIGADALGRFLVRRLERTLHSLSSYVAGRPSDPEARAVRREAAALLRQGRSSLARSAGGRPRASGRKRT